jgi:hypothetical protein
MEDFSVLCIVFCLVLHKVHGIDLGLLLKQGPLALAKIPSYSCLIVFAIRRRTG